MTRILVNNVLWISVLYVFLFMSLKDMPIYDKKLIR